jgi:hypothetical protein
MFARGKFLLGKNDELWQPENFVDQILTERWPLSPYNCWLAFTDRQFSLIGTYLHPSEEPNNADIVLR